MISVIIPTYKRNDLLAKCLDQLKPGVQTLGIENYEVIVTDDSKEFEAKEFITNNYSWANWVEGPHNGPAANRNNGAKNAKGEWLVFFDDDCIPDNNILKNYLIAFEEHKNIYAFEGRIYVDRPQKRLDEEAPINETGGYFWSCNIAIQKKTFIQLDGFDELFPYAAMEDVDLRTRLRENNFKIIFLNNAAVCHPWRIRSGYKNVIKFKINHYKSFKYYLHKHPNEKSIYNFKYKITALKNTLIDISVGCLKFKFKGISAGCAILSWSFIFLFLTKNNK